MASVSCNTNPLSFSHRSTPPNFQSRNKLHPPRRSSPSAPLRCSAAEEPKRRLSDQSSWEAKDAEGKDYLYRLGQEADNMNIAVGARQGVIDDLFTGQFLGRDSDIVFDYRQKMTRSFDYLQGDYYIAPVFLDKIACHIVKNYIAHLLNIKVPLILALDFYGALRSRTYDQSILKWVNEIGGYASVGKKLLKERKDGKLPTFIPPKQTVEALLESGHSLVKEQQLIMNSRLSKEYMKNMDE